MRLRCLLAVLAVAFAPAYAAEVKGPRIDISSFTLVPPWAVEDGAVYVVKLWIRWKDVERYLADYAKWYLPIDQYGCNSTIQNCESSGRKLLATLAREHGDSYNILFTWRYESSFKEDYYCKYTKAFFEYHARGCGKVDDPKGQCELGQFYNKVLAAHGLQTPLKTTVSQFPPRCADGLTRTERAALELARDTIHEIEMEYFAPKIESEEGSWNFDVNLCWLAGAYKDPTLRSKIREDVDLCPPSKHSLLERAVRELKWDNIK